MSCLLMTLVPVPQSQILSLNSDLISCLHCMTKHWLDHTYCISYIHVAVVKMPRPKQFGEERFYWAYDFRGKVHDGREV